MINARLITLTLLSMLAIGVPLCAMAENGLAPYERTGSIEDMDLKHNQVVINDTRYEIAPYVIVHGANKDIILRRDSLEMWMPVGFNVIQKTGHLGYINEMWLLKGTTPHSKE